MATAAERLRVARKRLQRNAQDLSDATVGLSKLGEQLKDDLDDRCLVTALELEKIEPTEAMWRLLAVAINQDEDHGVTATWLAEGTNPPSWAPEFYGSDILAVMAEHDISRTELADRIGVAASTLHNCILNHQRLGPAATTAIQSLGRVQDNSNVEALLQRTVEATCMALEDEETMKAINTLSKAQDVPVATLLSNIIVPRIMGTKQ
jgi:hypothetical protein